MSTSKPTVRLPYAGQVIAYESLDITLNDGISVATISGKLTKIDNWTRIPVGRHERVIVQIGDTNNPLFEGLVAEKRIEGNRFVITANSGEWLLTDDTTDRAFSSSTISSVVDYIIDGVSALLRRDDAYPTGSLTFNVTHRENYLDVAQRVGEQLNKDVWVARRGKFFKLKIGTRGKGSKSSPVQVFNTRSANTFIREYIITTPAVNSLRVISTGLVDITVPSPTFPMATASTSQSEYGAFSQVKVTSHDNTTSAYEFAKNLIEEELETKRVTFYYNGIPKARLGDYVRVVAKELGLDWTARVAELGITVREGGILSRVVVGRPAYDIYDHFDTLFERTREVY